MTNDPWHISVLIPARDEETLLPRCLRSVLAARQALPDTVTCDVVVAVDRSMDQTMTVARRALRDAGVAIRCDAGVVGVARATAARVGLQRGKQEMSRVWLANTDADCLVPETWLTDQLKLAKAGVQAVAGIVAVDSFVEHDPCVPERFTQTYSLRADGTHPHVHGANLGVRADAYLRAGDGQTFARRKIMTFGQG